MVSVHDWRNKSTEELIRPVTKPVSVTPSDTVDLVDGWCTAFCIAVGGSIKITDIQGNDVVLKLPVGWHPIGARRIWSTGTDAAVVTGGITAAYN